ncbi:MAG: hypothetical protein NVV63_00815 [Opitutus sp.]|nr:hypothetical protein [Opitutus sp.]
MIAMNRTDRETWHFVSELALALALLAVLWAYSHSGEVARPRTGTAPAAAGQISFPTKP